MKKFVWGFLFFCLATVISINGYAYTIDEIYSKFKTAYGKSKNLSAEFEETTLFKTRKSVVKGRFMFGKPNLIRKEIVAPKNPEKIVKTIVLDGKYAWTYVPLYNQVNRTKLNKAQQRQLLPGMGESLDDVPIYWNMELVPDEAANAKGVYQIKLTPKEHLYSNQEIQNDTKSIGKNIPVKKTEKEIIEIWLKEGEWLPVQFGYAIVSEDGSKTSIITTLSKIERDKKLSPKLFKFDIPKDAEVIDFSEK